MDRAQCIVYRNNRLLMVKHQLDGVEWWFLPGGGIQEGETPGAAAARELLEECCINGTIIRETGVGVDSPDDKTYSKTYTFIVDISDQEPRLGTDPDFPSNKQVLSEVKWVTLAEIPERDRAFLWAAGLLEIEEFFSEVQTWGDVISYPKKS